MEVPWPSEKMDPENAATLPFAASFSTPAVKYVPWYKLFVAVALRPDALFGAGASHTGRIRAGSAFTGLVNAFFISLIALIPNTNVGDTAVILGVAEKK